MTSALPIRLRVSGKRGFTLVELLVCIAIVATLAAVLMGSISGAIQSAQTEKCAGNLHAIGVALQQYATDDNNRLPQRYYADTGAGYSTILLPYVGNNAAVFTCPSVTSDWPAEPSYGMNWYYDNANLLSVQNLSQTILATDTKGSDGRGSNRADENSGDPGELATTRHRGEANYLFMDGHVERLSFAATQTTIAQNAQGPINMWGVDQGNHSETLAGGN